MKVKELIVMLQTFNPELEVLDGEEEPIVWAREEKQRLVIENDVPVLQDRVRVLTDTDLMEEGDAEE